jgi:hypothetical protein
MRTQTIALLGRDDGPSCLDRPIAHNGVQHRERITLDAMGNGVAAWHDQR